MGSGCFWTPCPKCPTSKRARRSAVKLFKRVAGKWTYHRYQTLAAYGFISLVFILVTAFVLGPMVSSLVLGFFRYDGIRPPKFVGLQNFQSLLGDRSASKSIWLTLYYMIGTLLVTITLAFVLAVLLSRKWLRGRQLFTSVLFFPYALPFVAAAFIWTWLFNPTQGVVNYLFELLGLYPQYWFRDPALAMPSIWIVGNWKFLGVFLIMYIAAIQNVSEAYYEAGKIDGIRNMWQEIRYITWPLTLPTTFFLVIFGMIGAFNAFDIVFVTTQGGPAHATRVAVYYVYELAFNLHRFGEGSALAFIMFVLLMLITYGVWRFYTSKVEDLA